MPALRRCLKAINQLGHARHCPICGFTGFRFARAGKVNLRPDKQCPRCRSRERHRAAYMLLQDRLGTDHHTIHCAPEPYIEKWLRSLSTDYLSIDLYEPAMRQIDLTDMDLESESSTLLWCSHVLEHIPEDGKAMREIFRVLKPGGVAVIQVPIRGDVTDEDPSVTTPQQRIERFGQ